MIDQVSRILVNKEVKRMLVLSRNPNEVIMIGDDIKIVIVDIRGDKVRVGIQAPMNLPVHREEVFKAIKRTQQEGKEGK